jgi:hypothetical protein
VVARGFGERDESVRPGGEVNDGRVDSVAHIQAQIGGDLFVAAAAGVQFERDGAGALLQFQLEEVVHVFRCGRRYVQLACCEVFADCVQAVHDLLQFCGREDACRCDGPGVRGAGEDFLPDEAPVKRERPLPVLEGLVQWLAEAARPHLDGCFVRHYDPLSELCSWGISEPLLSLMRPVAAYVASFARVSVMSRLRMVS